MDDTGTVLFTTAITVGLAAAAGFGVYRLTSPKGEVKNPSGYGRKWFAWTAMLVCVTMLPKFFRSFDLESFFSWVALLIAYGGLASVLGWAYGKFYKFRASTSVNIPLSNADAPSLTPPVDPAAPEPGKNEQEINRLDEPQDAEMVSKGEDAGKAISQNESLRGLKVSLLVVIIIIIVFSLYKIYPTEYGSSYSTTTDNNGSEESTQYDPLETREQATLESELKLEGLKKKASAGDPDAQRDLGYIYYEGDGVHQDYVEAEKWYRLAAEQGEIGAQETLGEMYANGKEIPQNFIKAHMWYNLAATLRLEEVSKYSAGLKLLASSIHKDDLKARDAVAQKMTSAQIAEAQRLASEWYEKHRSSK